MSIHIETRDLIRNCKTIVSRILGSVTDNYCFQILVIDVD